MASESKERQEAQRRAKEAQERLEKAREEAAEANSGLSAMVTKGVPMMRVVVNPGCHVSHEDKPYYGEGYPFAPKGHSGGDEVDLDGPTALALMQQGQVSVKGAV